MDENEGNINLPDFIRSEREKGVSDDDIRRVLEQEGGWNQDDLNNAFSQLNQQPQEINTEAPAEQNNIIEESGADNAPSEVITTPKVSPETVSDESSPIRTPEGEEKHVSISDFFKSHFHFSIENKNVAIGSGLVLLLIVVSALIISSVDFGKKGSVLASREYSQAYSFVSNKISKSAAVVLSLPEGVSKAEAYSGIVFEPEVKGEWLETDNDRTVAYKPASSLETGIYYAVHLETPTVQLTSDFLVDEDPTIEAVFPASGSEANENSSITIVFNRPMVPLTTLDELDKEEIPISITPNTEGRFKWISTRNLQFIPEERLQRSSNYKVTIGDGLTSMDGLSVAGASHEFTTRPLRYRNLHSGETLYNQPITIYFNQPVDLDRTRGEIEVRNTSSNKEVTIDVSYGTRSVFNDKKKEYEDVTDRSVLHVIQKTDTHGRSKLWDFKSNYTLTINKALPLEGDILLTQAKNTNIQVPDIIDSITANSERSNYVEPHLFDPQGELVVKFFEEVDVSKSRIEVKGLENTKYGEVCKKDEDGYTMYLGSGECDMEEDKQTLVLSFDNSQFGLGENVPITFEKIYNLEGLKINPDPITESITTYPKLTVNKTVPGDNSAGASVTELYVCSNSPLKGRSSEEYQDFLSADNRIVFSRWGGPRKIERASSYNKCAVGEYQTNIRYGLLPETQYQLEAVLEDDFGQREEQSIAFTTTAPDSRYFRFHNLQQVYNVTPAERTKLTYAVENLEFMDLHICKVKPEVLLDVMSDNEGSTNCESVKTDRIDLPKVYWVNNYFQVNLADYFDQTLGHYIITMSNPDYRNTWNNTLRKERTYVSVTNLAVGEKKVKWEPYSSRYGDQRDLDGRLIEQNKNLYWVNDVHTLKPVVGATVSIYSQEGRESPFRFRTTYTTDSEGVAQGGAVERAKGAVIRHLNDSAIISEWADQLQYASRAEEGGRTYMYTDRPIYRPGQEVFVRGLDRIGFDGTYEIHTEHQPEVKVFDSRGSTIFQQKLEQTEFGTFSTQFVIPDDAPLGVYRISAFGNTTFISVEEFVPAAFKLEVDTEEEEYIAGQTMNLNVDANYFFGVPLDGGEVSYSVTSQDYYFDKYTDEYFNFGRGWYYCYSCGYGDEFLFRGKAELDGNGKAQISEVIDFNKFYKDPLDEQSKIFVVNVTVQDSNGRSVSAQKSFVVHRGEVYLGVKAERSFGPKNQDISLRVKSVDTEGEEVAQRNIVLEINKITWKVFKRREVDGGFYYRSEEEKTQVKRETISTDRDGNYTGSFNFPEEGRYEIKVSSTDSLKNPIVGTTNVYIYGEGQVSIRPTNNHSLDLETERQDVSVGDKPKILIQSPFEKAKALITVDRGKVFDYWVVDIDRNLYDHEIPIKSEYAPNVFVSVLLLSDDPEIKYGQLQFNVDAEQRELTVDVKPNKQNYLPGEEVTLDITTTNYLDKPVPAEVSIAVADLSVLALKGNPKKNPLVFFYNGFPLTVTTASNIKNILHEIDIPLGTKGGGGGDPDDLATRKRGVFKDTAYWNAHVVTDKNGKATLSFTLPDNLTTWQIESLGITKDTLLGVDYDEVLARKDLMVVPLKPRFVIPGDEFSIGAKVFNQTEQKQKFDITISSDSLELTGDTRQSLSLAPNTTETIYFDVKAPEQKDSGKHVFEISAKNNQYEDTVENTISITKNDTYETVATASFTKANLAREYIYVPENVIPDKGGLTVNTNATMAVFLGDALDYLVSYPYGCSEQLASKLSSIAVVKRGLNLENVGDKFTLDDITFEGETYTVEEAVRLALARIYVNQVPGGGFTYYPGLQPSFHLSLHVVQALNDLKKAGFDVNEDSLQRGSQYLYQTITNDHRYYQNKDLVILTTYVLQDIDSISQNQKDTLSQRVAGIAQDKNYVNEDISSVSLAYLSIITADGYSNTVKDNVFEALENRIDVDGRGAYLKGHVTNNLWQSYETPVKNTALLLKAITAHENEHSLLDKVLRYLLRSRAKDGAWGSTNNTLTTIDAMTDYLSWQRETESNFALSLDLDGEKVFDADFNPDTILDTFTEFLPINTFLRNTTQTLTFTREDRNDLENNFYYDMALQYFLPADQIPPRDEGITISRGLYSLDDEDLETPLQSANVGDVLRGRITITIPKNYNFVSIEDYIPAGFELVNFNLSTEDQSLKTKGSIGGKTFAAVEAEGLLARTWGAFKNIFSSEDQSAQAFRAVDTFDYVDEIEAPNRTLRPSFEEIHDDRVFLFTERIAPGVYEYDYYVRALVPGTFHHLPAVASEMYFPEVFGRTEGNYFTITND